MSEGTIIVLEDREERVNFLRKLFPTFRILSFEDVSPFVKAVAENLDTLRLVVFDHDLGRVGPPDGMYGGSNLFYDAEGKTGADAAYEVEPFGVPALVWSQNNSGRKTIASLLSKGRKATWIQEAPFRDSVDFAATVAKMLR